MGGPEKKKMKLLINWAVIKSFEPGPVVSVRAVPAKSSIT